MFNKAIKQTKKNGKELCIYQSRFFLSPHLLSSFHLYAFVPCLAVDWTIRKDHVSSVELWSHFWRERVGEQFVFGIMTSVKAAVQHILEHKSSFSRMLLSSIILSFWIIIWLYTYTVGINNDAQFRATFSFRILGVDLCCYSNLLVTGCWLWNSHHIWQLQQIRQQLSQVPR